MSILDDLLNSARNLLKRNVDKEINNAKSDLNNALYNAANTKTKTVTLASLPTTLEELKAMPDSDLKDPYAVAAYTVAALCEFDKNREASIEMLNYLKGPRPLSNMEISFIEDRFMDGVDYIPRSYLEGTSPDNDYTPKTPYKVVVKEFATSRENINDGYLRLFLRSSGADTERFIDLRLKPSTQQWFLWDYAGILSGIRIPKSQDAWA